MHLLVKAWSLPKLWHGIRFESADCEISRSVAQTVVEIQDEQSLSRSGWIHDLNTQYDQAYTVQEAVTLSSHVDRALFNLLCNQANVTGIVSRSESRSPRVVCSSQTSQ